MSSASTIKAGQAFVEVSTRDNMTKSLAGMQRKLKAFGAAVQQIGANMARTGLAMAAPMALATRIFAGFDDQMRMVKAVTGATGREFESLTELAKELGRSTSFTAGQVAAAMVELGRAGFSTKEIENSIGHILNLSKATGTELPRSAEIAANTLRAFGIEASQTQRAVNVLVATANGSAQTLDDLFEAIKFAAQGSELTGQSFEDTAAVLAKLADVGLKGSLAGTGLRRAMALLAAPTDEAGKMLMDLGVATTDTSGNMRRMVDIFDDLAEAMDGMPNQQKAEIFNRLFGLLGMGVGLNFSRTSGGVREFSGELKSLRGNAAATAKEMESGIGGSLRRLLSALEGVAISIGDAIAPVVENLAKGMQSAATWIRKFIDENKALAQIVALTAVGLIAGGAALFTFGLAISATVAAVSTIASAVMGFISIVSGVSVVGVAIAAVVGLVAALAAINVALFVFSGAWRDVWTFAKDIFSNVFGHLKENFKLISDLLSMGESQQAWRAAWATIQLTALKAIHELAANAMRIPALIYNANKQMLLALIDFAGLAMKNVMSIIASGGAVISDLLKEAFTMGEGQSFLDTQIERLEKELAGMRTSVEAKQTEDAHKEGLKAAIAEAEANKRAKDEKIRLEQEAADAKAALDALRESEKEKVQSATSQIREQVQETRGSFGYRSLGGTSREIFDKERNRLLTEIAASTSETAKAVKRKTGASFV